MTDPNPSQPREEERSAEPDLEREVIRDLTPPGDDSDAVRGGEATVEPQACEAGSV